MDTYKKMQQLLTFTNACKGMCSISWRAYPRVGQFSHTVVRTITIYAVMGGPVATIDILKAFIDIYLNERALRHFKTISAQKIMELLFYCTLIVFLLFLHCKFSKKLNSK